MDTECHEKRLDRSDAVFVDVIHSAGKWVGNDDVAGHADFFPNLGVAPQPGCVNKESIDLSCSHWMVSSDHYMFRGPVKDDIKGCVLSSRICTPSIFSPSPLCGRIFRTKQALNL